MHHFYMDADPSFHLTAYRVPSYSLDVIYGGPGISIANFDQKNMIFFAVNFFKFLIIKILDPELDPDPDGYPA